MKVYAARRHYRDHADPVWEALSASTKAADGYALCFSYRDVLDAKRAGERHIARLAHGTAQSYPGRDTTRHSPFCPGGINNGMVEVFLTPNQYAADLWSKAYPKATVEVVGQLRPRPDRRPGQKPVVAVSFHWSNNTIPEARPATPHFRPGLPSVARRFPTILHGHPRAIGDIERIGRETGIEVVRDFDEVCSRADVYVCDNSSTIYEFAATGRPVVLMDPPWYSRRAKHGLRFWDWDIGPHAAHPEELVGAIGRALEAGPPPAAAVRRAFAYPDGARRAAKAIERWVKLGG